MPPSNASCDFLAHFDPEQSSEAPLVRPVPWRGVGWTVMWAAAIGVFFLAAGALIQFVCCFAAEQALVRAAQAGALEATLPRATRHSILKTIERRLTESAISPKCVSVSLVRNDAPLRTGLQLAGNDRVAVHLSVPTEAALPAWMRSFRFWRDESLIRVHAERQVPGRNLAN